MFTRGIFRSAAVCSIRGIRTVSRPTILKSVHRQKLISGGLTTGLAIAFYTTKKEEESQSEAVKVPSYMKNFDKIVQETDALYDNYLIDNAYAILRRFGSSDNSELLWRLARVLCEKAKLSKDKNDRKELMYEAFAVVNKALEHEPPVGSFGAHKWFAILLDYIGEIEGNKSRIEKSYIVKEHLEKALSIDGSDATTWYILGVWHYSFADMPGYTRMIAKAIFGTPPASTYEEALKHFEKAEQIQPNFYSTNTFAIGEVHEKLGDKEKALTYYKQAFMMPVLTADDQAAHKKAHDKLSKAGVKDSELLQR